MGKFYEQNKTNEGDRMFQVEEMMPRFGGESKCESHFAVLYSFTEVSQSELGGT